MTNRIGFVLDRSASMQAVRQETIDGFNTWLKGVKATDRDARITMIQFDDYSIDTLYADVKVSKVAKLDKQSYQPRGNTPLYDAVARGIRDLEMTTSKGDRVLLVIQTDGEENASTEYGWEQLAALIKKRQKAGWEIAYLGAGDDQWVRAQARKIGVAAGSTQSYVPTPAGTTSGFSQTTTSTQGYLSGQTVAGAFFDLDDDPDKKPKKKGGHK